MPVEEEKAKKMVTSSMPLRRAREYYEKYGKEMVGGIMGDFFYFFFFFFLVLFDTHCLFLLLLTIIDCLIQSYSGKERKK